MLKALFAVLLMHLCGVAYAGSSTRLPAGDEIAVITNWGGDSVSIVNIKTGKELSQIKVCAKPYDVKVEDGGAIAYVTCSGENFIAVVDLVANLERRNERIIVGQSPRDIELTKDGTRAVVANSGSDDISVVDLGKRKEIYRAKVGPIPYGVALTEGDKTAIITLWGSAKAVFVKLGPTNGTVQSVVSVGALPYTVYPSRKGNFALVTCFGDEAVYILDVKNQKVHSRVQVGRSPWGLTLSPDGKTAVVANFYDGSASILSVNDTPPDPLAASGSPVTEVGRVPLSKADPLAASAGQGRGKNAAFSSDPSLVLMSDLALNQVMILDVSKRQITKTILVGQAPYGIAFIPKK